MRVKRKDGGITVEGIIGLAGYSVTQKIDLASSCYLENNQPRINRKYSFSNSDYIHIIDYLNNSVGLGISRRKGYTHFKDINTGAEWQWDFDDSCISSWTSSWGMWGYPCGDGFNVGDIIGKDREVEIYTHFDSPVNMNTSIDTITVGDPVTPTPTPPPGITPIECIFPRILTGDFTPRITTKDIIPRITCLSKVGNFRI